MVTSKTFIPVPGSTFFDDASLAYVTILRLCVEGTGYNATTGSPGNREYKYEDFGRVSFLNPFPGSPVTDVNRQRLFIKYKYT